MWSVWLLVAFAVVAAIAYIAWEFRWYWRTLSRAWRNDTDRPERTAAERERDLARHTSLR